MYLRLVEKLSVLLIIVLVMILDILFILVGVVL